MVKNLYYTIVLLSLLLFTSFACQYILVRPDKWTQAIPDVGSMSSPVAVDLNKDEVKDIVIGGLSKGLFTLSTFKNEISFSNFYQFITPFQ